MEFLSNAVRVLKMARKPNREELVRIAKITGAGILILGAVGYVIHLIYFLLKVGI